MKLRLALTPSTVRNFPRDELPDKGLHPIHVARNERFSFQAAVRVDSIVNVQVGAEAPEGWSVRIRRVGLVPVEHHGTPVSSDPLETDGIGAIPGFVPDPLFDEPRMLLPQDETHSFWITVQPGEGARPGRYAVSVFAAPAGDGGEPCARPIVRKAVVNVHGVDIKLRRDFHVTHWLYSDALIDRYRTRLFDERYWAILERYLRDISDHGQDMVYVPVFTPPLDGVKRPAQLLRVARAGRDRYRFDWRDVRRYVRLAQSCGITHFEWCHLFTQWGARNAIRIYEGQGDGERLLWPADTPATSATYGAFLGQYLPALKRFLDSEGIRDASFFHVSDEPHGDEMRENYRAARAILAKHAPWMKCMDALSQIEFAREKGLVDLPVSCIDHSLDFIKEGMPLWCYYCCCPRGAYLNHLMDTPLAKVAMQGFLFYRWPFGGFLHWGLNYWYASQTRTLIDPFACSDGRNWPGWAHGDTFLVYPGEDGPIDSIRWELFAEAMQDYALLQTLGVDRDGELLSAIRSFSDFPKDAAWRLAVRARLLRGR